MCLKATQAKMNEYTNEVYRFVDFCVDHSVLIQMLSTFLMESDIEVGRPPKKAVQILSHDWLLKK